MTVGLVNAKRNVLGVAIGRLDRRGWPAAAGLAGRIPSPQVWNSTETAGAAGAARKPRSFMSLMVPSHPSCPSRASSEIGASSVAVASQRTRHADVFLSVPSPAECPARRSETMTQGMSGVQRPICTDPLSRDITARSTRGDHRGPEHAWVRACGMLQDNERQLRQRVLASNCATPERVFRKPLHLTQPEHAGQLGGMVKICFDALLLLLLVVKHAWTVSPKMYRGCCARSWVF